jgi:hypothetical protein
MHRRCSVGCRPCWISITSHRFKDRRPYWQVPVACHNLLISSTCFSDMQDFLGRHIAKHYSSLKQCVTMRELLLAVRADEAGLHAACRMSHCFCRLCDLNA